MHRGSGLIRAYLTLLALLLSSGAAMAQECPQGRISYIFIDNRSIFDTSELPEEVPFRWAYDLANTLHIRTREEFIRKELLFRTGDCLDPLRLSESERLLRGYRFIAKSDVFALPQPDGTQHVVVDTQDEWTTRVDLGFKVEDGPKITGIELAEENFLGRGVGIRVFYEQYKEQRDIGVEVDTPRLLNTRLDGRVSGGRTRNGRFFEESLYYPFVGEVGRFGARQSYLWRETLFSYVLQDAAPYTNLLVPHLDDRWDLVVGGRLGEPGNLTVFGGGVSRESVRFREFPSDVELVRERDFSRTDPADEASVDTIMDQAKTRTTHRLNIFLGERNLRYLQRRGLDALRGIQDVQVGTEIFIGLGRSLDVRGSQGERLPNDTHTQLSAFAGGAWDGWILNTQLSMEARQVDAEEGHKRRWEDIFAEADAFLYWQPAGSQGRHTVLFRLSATGGWTVQTPYQLTLGGPQALRGYRDYQFPGGRRIILSAEDRVYFSWPAPELLDFGLSFFLDLGHMHPGGVPFGEDSGWKASVGAGVRFGLPPGTGNMYRVDLAFPLGPRARLKDLILRIELQEILGLLPGFRDEQLVRSLRSGVRPTMITQPW